MSKKVHFCVSIDGLLKQKNLNDYFKTENGIGISDQSARKYLSECKQNGWRVLPMGNCDNFDYQEGCLGHDIDKNDYESEK